MEVKMAKAALELYSIRELMEKNVYTSLESTAKAGYDGVEFAGFFDEPAQKIKDKLDELGLEVCGSHTGYNLLTENIDSVFSYNKTINNKNIILPSLDKSMRQSADDWKKTAKLFTEIGKKCADNGFQFAYHNHAFEFERFDGVTGWHILVDNIDTEYVKLQPDMGWVFYAGEDTDQFIKDYGHLVSTVHVKQFKAQGSEEATEVHKGLLYYPPVIKAYMDLGVEWFIIEQEGFDIPMLESIRINAEELKKMFK
jgi:sugar phosphate isomerase/epimerase